MKRRHPYPAWVVALASGLLAMITGSDAWAQSAGTPSSDDIALTAPALPDVAAGVPPSVEASSSTSQSAITSTAPFVPVSHGPVARGGRIGSRFGKIKRGIEKVTGLRALDRALTSSKFARDHPKLAAGLRTAKAAGVGFVFTGFNPVGAAVAAGRYATLSDSRNPIHQTLANTAPGRYLRVHRNAALYAQIAAGAAMGAATGGGSGALKGGASPLGATAGSSMERDRSDQGGDPERLARAEAYAPPAFDPSILDVDEARQYRVAARFAPILVQGHNDDSATVDTPTDPFRPGESNILYDVKETGSHYFLTYLVYHRGDSKRIGVGNHANDLEGVTIAVEKSTEPGRERPVGVITLAHNEFFASDLTKGKRLMDGDRLVVRMEAGAHGLYAVNARKPGLLDRIKGALDLRAQTRNRLVAQPSTSTIRYEPGDSGGPVTGEQASYGLRPLSDAELEKLDDLFAGTPGNGAQIPTRWEDPGRTGPGELFTDPHTVFSRLLHWKPPRVGAVAGIAPVR